LDLGIGMNIVQVAEGLPGTFSGLQGLSKDARRRPGAATTYLAFQSSAADAVSNLRLIVNIGVPPPLKGGLWCWPAVYRAHRRLVDTTSEMIVAFGQMVMLGNYDVVEAAHEFGMEFSKCAADLPMVRGRIAMTDEFSQRLDAAVRALRTFTLAARKDLNVPGRNAPAAIDGRGEDEAPHQWWQRKPRDSARLNRRTED
jgi:hypothetical protein